MGPFAPNRRDFLCDEAFECAGRPTSSVRGGGGWLPVRRWGPMPPSGVTTFNIADDTFIVCDAAVLGRCIVEPARTALWWPGLTHVVTRNRGRQGVQWHVTGQWSGRMWTGTMEIWLEAVLDGVVLHHYVRLDPVGEGLTEKRLRELTTTYAMEWKQRVFALKDELEAGRVVGVGGGPTSIS